MLKIVDIQGGLGNQLFQYCFALKLKKEKGLVRLFFGKGYIEKQKVDSFRSIGFNPNFFGLKELSKFSYHLVEFVKWIPFFGKKFYTIHKEKTGIRTTKNYLLTSYNGFWQDLVFLESSILEIKYIIEKNIKFQPNNKTLLHIRRSDFKKNNLSLKINFYQKALSNIDKNISNISFDIFTDDTEWVNQQEISKLAKNIFGPTQEKDDAFKNFEKMLGYKNYIIGNSTFSLWPALISSKIDSKIILEKGFYERLNISKTQHYNHWTSI